MRWRRVTGCPARRAATSRRGGDERGRRDRVCERLELEPCRDLEALAQRLAHLGPCSLLLHDVEGAAEAVRELMRAATAHAHELMIVATSRFALDSRCARVVLLEPLTVEAATELFLARTRAASPPALRAWADPAVRAQVAGLVQRLDHLPLAIELAAARTAVLSPRELAQHLERRFDVLHAPLGRGTGRHASPRAALDGSWALLSPLDREVLMACARFAGPFSAVAVREALAQAALHEGGALLDTLHRLVAYSLVANLHDDAVEPQLVLPECVRTTRSSACARSRRDRPRSLVARRRAGERDAEVGRSGQDELGERGEVGVDEREEELARERDRQLDRVGLGVVASRRPACPRPARPRTPRR